MEGYGLAIGVAANGFSRSGFMALENLVWFGVNRPETFKAIKDKAHGRRSEFEYPFAVAGVN